MSKLDLTKPVQTRSGCKVTVLKTDLRGGNYPILALVHEPYADAVRTFTVNGYFHSTCSDHAFNLVNVPQVTTEYCNLYENGTHVVHSSKPLADLYQTKREPRIACLKITKTDGVITDVSLA